MTAYDGALPPQRQAVGAEAAPFGLSDPLVVLAGEADGVVDRVEITWPSGYVQELLNLPTDQIHEIVEPELIQLSSDDRHLRANGQAELTVTATARTPDGAANPAAVVSIELASGTGTWIGPAVQVGDHWERVLQAPNRSGHARVEVRVDGAPLWVVPRVWWD